MLPNVTTEIAFATDPNAAIPTWTNVSDYVKSCSPNHGRDDEYSAFGPGTNQLVLRNNDRRFDPTYAAGAYYPNVLPNKRIRQYVPLSVGLEFWGDFEAGAAGTAPEWTAMNGLLECKAGSEARQLQYPGAPAPRLGARIARFEVTSGDQFGATSGERCEVRRGATNGGFGTGDCEGDTVYTQFSARFLAPWTLTGEGIFQQTHDSGSTYGAPMFRWRMGSASTFDFRVVTGRYPNSTDAGNGVNAGTSKIHAGLTFNTDLWYDFRHVIYYTTGNGGWYIAEMKLSTDTLWTLVAREVAVATLPSYPGSAATSQFDKLGFYRGTPQASTNVVFHDGYQVAHSQDDAGYSTQTADSRWNDKGWEGRELATQQVGNPDFEADVTGTTAAGGGVTTITRDTARSKFGSAACKAVTNGAASGQGVFHRKRSGSRYDVVEGHTYTSSMWMSGDGFEEMRIGMEWSDAGGAVLSTTYCEPRALRTDFRRLYITAVAPANAVTMRIRTSYSGTTAGTFWVDGVDFWEGTTDHFLFEGNIDNWGTDWPDRFLSSDVTVQASDRFKRLAVRAQPTSNPSVEGYADVLGFDEPSFYYRMGEPAGTKAVSHIRRKKVLRDVESGKKGGYIWVQWGTKKRKRPPVEVEGVSGPAGTYKNTPLLGEPGFIAGDPDTCVKFRSANSEYARVGPLDQSDLIDRNALTCEAWVKLSSTGATMFIVSGPKLTALGNDVFRLNVDGTPKLNFQIFSAAGTSVAATGATTLVADTTYHVAGTWDGSTARVYLNGALDGSAGGGIILAQGDANEYIRIAAEPLLSGTFFNGWIDEVAIYEKALSASRLLAHYTAGLRGFDQEATGTRIQNVLDASDLGFPYSLMAGAGRILPVRQFGQSSVDPIQEAEATEGGFAGFFFNAGGVASFLERDYRDAYPYTTNQATFGDLGDGTEIAYEALGFDHGERFLANIVRVEAEGGETQEVQDATSVADFDEAALEATGIPMVSDGDALTEANWLLSRSKTPRWRITSVAFEVEMIDRYDQTQQALSREIGDAVTVKRRPLGGTVFSQISSVERVSHAIDFEGRTWVTTLGLAPLADDLSTGWILGVPGATELQSTMVLN